MHKTLLFIIIVQLLIVHEIIAQDVNIELVDVNTIKSKIESDIITDLNGDTCSLVYINIETKGIKFYANRGVEKIEELEKGYKVWIPHETTILKIAIPQFPLYEYKLPKSVFKYATYIINIETKFNQEYVYVDTLGSVLSISTTPSDARVHIDGEFVGRTPVKIDNPEFNHFHYSIKKNRYEKIIGNDSIDSKLKSLDFNMVDISRQKRIFAIITVTGMMPVNGAQQYPSSVWGLKLGSLGKTGWFTDIKYSSLNPDELKKEYIYNSYRFTDNFSQFRFSLGLTQQFSHSVFGNIGVGYAKRNMKWENPTIINNDIPMNYIVEDFSYIGVTINMGFMFRIFWNLIIHTNYAINIDGLSSIMEHEFGFGIGINLDKKD